MTLNLSKAPLKDAIVEIHYKTTLPSQVVAGLFFKELQELDYEEFEELPIVQLPPQIRDGNEDLKYNAHYRIKKEKYWVSVSSTVIAISCVCKNNAYQGWTKYKAEIDKVLGAASRLELIPTVAQASVRFINLFDDENILDEVNLQVNAPFNGGTFDDLTVNFTEKKEDFKMKVTLSSEATATDADGEKISGSLLDITAYKSEEIVYENLLTEIDEAHRNVEEMFIELLHGSILERLK